MFEIKHYPNQYHYRSDSNSDRNWIMSRMRKIPVEKQEEVSTEYVRIFMATRNNGNARRAANTYLDCVARGYMAEMNGERNN